MQTGIENIVSELAKQYDDLCKEAFGKCGYNLEYVLENPNVFFKYHEDFVTGYRDTFFLGNPAKGNALALFEIEQIADFDENKIFVQCNMLDKTALV